MPICANTPGIVSVPTRPSTGATASKRPRGVHDLPSSFFAPPERRPTPASFSTPTARPMSHSPAFTAMIAVRSAVAPVAHALATLKTGMPVWPICFCSCWPMPALAAIRLPAASTPMSFIVTPASFSAAMAASAARSTVSRSGCLPNLVMWIPRIQTLSLIACLLACSGRLEAETDGLVAVVVRADRVGGELDLHAEVHVVRIGFGVDHVAPHARAVAVDQPGDERHRDARR